MILASVHIYWLILPLVIAISLVYSASRHESWSRITVPPALLASSPRLLGILSILVVATAVLLLINTQV